MVKEGFIMAGGGAERERESVGFDSSIEYKQTEEPKIKDIKTRIGLKLCMITIIGLVALEAVVVIAYFLITWYSVRSFDQTATAELLTSYNEARSAIADDILKIGEQFLGKLVPVITLLLGYMFGSRMEKDEEGD